MKPVDYNRQQYQNYTRGRRIAQAQPARPDVQSLAGAKSMG